MQVGMIAGYFTASAGNFVIVDSSRLTAMRAAAWRPPNGPLS